MLHGKIKQGIHLQCAHIFWLSLQRHPQETSQTKTFRHLQKSGYHYYYINRNVSNEDNIKY